MSAPPWSRGRIRLPVETMSVDRSTSIYATTAALELPGLFQGVPATFSREVQGAYLIGTPVTQGHGYLPTGISAGVVRNHDIPAKGCQISGVTIQKTA